MMMTRRITRCLLPLLLAAYVNAPVQAQQTDSAAAKPRLLNASEVADTLGQRHPAVLREQGIGGAARVRLFVNEEGVPDTVRTIASTGLFRLDRAIDAAAQAARFSTDPTGAPVGWVVLPLSLASDSSLADFQHVPLAMSPEEAGAAALEFYPEDFRRLQLGASVSVALNVDSAGRVIVPVVVDPSCFDTGNQAALDVVRSLRFEPRTDGGAAMRRTYASITFLADSVRVRMQGQPFESPKGVEAADSVPRRRLITRRPELRNRSSVQRALVSNYPRHLRDAGVGGTATVWFMVETDGRVTYRTISETSGYCELDIAGMAVAHVMEFEPALNDGKPVRVWVEIPIVFRAR